MQVDWWGAYGNNDSTYGGVGHSGTDRITDNNLKETKQWQHIILK